MLVTQIKEIVASQDEISDSTSQQLRCQCAKMNHLNVIILVLSNTYFMWTLTYQK